jgi:hypothetical protein
MRFHRSCLPACADKGRRRMPRVACRHLKQ